MKIVDCNNVIIQKDGMRFCVRGSIDWNRLSDNWINRIEEKYYN